METKKIKNKKGFTLLEVVIAMFVFVLVMMASTATFARAFRAYGDAKDIQENMENAQYAMNLMAKTFRTSSVMDSGSNYVEVYDYSQEKCFNYSFSGTELVRAEGSGSDPDNCSTSGSAIMTSGDVTGVFDVEESEEDVSVGKITVSMTITKGSNTVHLQTTTSLRDYSVSGISL